MPHDAFGNEKDRVGSDPNPFRYCGEYFDVESGAYYLRARYYDPSVGRFTQEDAACFGLNWYAYCGNNPIRFHDPTGYKPEITVNVNDTGAGGRSEYTLTFWQLLRLNKGLVDLTYYISEIMNFINDITVAPLSEAVKLANRLIRKQHPYTDTAGNPKYIYGQGNDEIAGLPFGMSKIEDSGCEVIAVYNAMIYLGDSELFPDVVRYFEDRGSFCGGLFGTHVNAIPQYFF